MKPTARAPLAALAILSLAGCGATYVRPLPPPDAKGWPALTVKVHTPDPEDAGALSDEVARTHLFAGVAKTPEEGDTAQLTISGIEEHVDGKLRGGLCFDYAASYLTLGIIPEVCDQDYDVTIDVTAPGTGRAEQVHARLTQRRFIGFFGLVTSLFGKWHFFGPTPGDPVLARAALLDQKSEIDALMKPQ